MLRSLLLTVLAGALLLVVASGAQAASRSVYYVALGDSYAVGWQPGQGATAASYPQRVVRSARARGWKLKLVNFGCAGATTASILQQPGCPAQARALGAPAYSATQVEAAVAFLRQHRKQIALISVSISGNDVTSCVAAADPITCVVTATTTIKANVSRLAKRLHQAAPKARLVGTTYPDVVLGEYVRPGGNQQLAGLSVVAFKSMINPALVSSYAAGRGRLVDVTAATGAYTPLTETTTLEPYGTIPVAVARVCQLTWYCEKGDIHANAEGYALIGDLVARRLSRR